MKNTRGTKVPGIADLNVRVWMARTEYEEPFRSTFHSNEECIPKPRKDLVKHDQQAIPSIGGGGRAAVQYQEQET